MDPTQSNRCRVCGTPAMEPFVEIGTLPAHIGVLWRDRERARSCPRGDIDLALCTTCGFVYNLSFDPSLMAYLDEDYDNTLDFSAVFTDYARTLSAELDRRYRLQGGHVIDVGCGKGEFLKTLCSVSGARGTGYDPSAPVDGDDDRVTFVREFYSRAHADRPADLITCRHVFEHIAEPIEFLDELRQAIGTRSVPVYFEVPSLRNILRGNSPWEIIYEHCSYFGEESLRLAFERCGFVVDDVRPMYNDLYLGLWAHPGPANRDAAVAGNVDDVTALAGRFATLFRDRVNEWRDRVDGWRRDGVRAVAWGAGARGTTFVNLLAADDAVPYLVDINPRKRGKYVPGTGQEIIAPDGLAAVDPGAVIVMNAVYLEEIRAQVTAMQLNPEFLTA